MRHALMQQGTLDVRFPRACGKIQADTLRGDVIPAPDVFLPQESRPRMSGEPTSSARRITSTGICCFPARKDTWRASSSIRTSLERNICPSRAISSVETASVFRLLGGSKIQPAFHVACFHLPCSGTVFLYTAPEAADVVHKIEISSHTRICACHRVQAGSCCPSILSRHKLSSRFSAANMPSGVLSNRRPPESFRQWPARYPGSHSPPCF